MRPSSSRRFTLFDAMVLVAATGLALVLIRYVYDEKSIELVPAEWMPGEVWDWIAGLSAIVTPFVVIWSLAVGILALKRPRPALRRVFREPGMAASTAIVVWIIYSTAQLLAIILLEHIDSPSPLRKFYEDLNQTILTEYTHQFGILGKGIAAVWVVLWLGRAWRPQPSWIDRTGRILGAYCIVNSIVCGWNTRFIY